MDRAGGILNQAIPEFRLDDATVDREIAEMTTRGVSWHLGTTVGRDICLEAEDEMPVLASELVELRSVGVELHVGRGPAELVDAGVRFVRCGSVFDAEGCFAPQLDPGEEMVRDADRVVAAVGQRPASG